MRVGVVGLLVWCSGQALAQDATSPWTDAAPAEAPPQEQAPAAEGPSAPEPSGPAAPADPGAAVDPAAPVDATAAVDAAAPVSEAAVGEPEPAAASAPAAPTVTPTAPAGKAAAKSKKRKPASGEAEAAMALLLDAQGVDTEALDVGALEGVAEAMGSLTAALGGVPTAGDGDSPSAGDLPEDMLSQAAAALPAVIEALGGVPAATEEADVDATDTDTSGPQGGATPPSAASVLAEAAVVAPVPAPAAVAEPVVARVVAEPKVVAPVASTATVVGASPAPEAVRAVKAEGAPALAVVTEARTAAVEATAPVASEPPTTSAPSAPQTAGDQASAASAASEPAEDSAPAVASATGTSTVLQLGGTAAYEVQTLGGPVADPEPPAPTVAPLRPAAPAAAAGDVLPQAPRDLKRRVPELPVAYEAILGTKRIVCAAEVRLDGSGRADRVGVTTCPAAMKLAVADALTDWRWPEGTAGWFAVEVPVARSVRGASGRLYHPGFTELSPERPATGSRDLPVLVKSGKMPVYPRQVYHGDATCLVSATILRTGKSADVRIDDCTTPYRVELNKVVKGWRWYPAESDGLPTPANIEFEVSFRLEQAAR
ncbi:MAG: hypothetical protein RLZZ383_19 [Pseudomonadota bacterium]|jgi:hypothetical protein